MISTIYLGISLLLTACGPTGNNASRGAGKTTDKTRSNDAVSAPSDDTSDTSSSSDGSADRPGGKRISQDSNSSTQTNSASSSSVSSNANTGASLINLPFVSVYEYINPIAGTFWSSSADASWPNWSKRTSIQLLSSPSGANTIAVSACTATVAGDSYYAPGWKNQCGSWKSDPGKAAIPTLYAATDATSVPGMTLAASLCTIPGTSVFGVTYGSDCPTGWTKSTDGSGNTYPTIYVKAGPSTPPDLATAFGSLKANMSGTWSVIGGDGTRLADVTFNGSAFNCTTASSGLLGTGTLSDYGTAAKPTVQASGNSITVTDYNPGWEKVQCSAIISIGSDGNGVLRGAPCQVDLITVTNNFEGPIIQSIASTCLCAPSASAGACKLQKK